jgi:hypothetical protein
MGRDPFGDIGRIFEGLGRSWDGMSRGLSRAERGWSRGSLSGTWRGLRQAGRASQRGFDFSRKAVAWIVGTVSATIFGLYLLFAAIDPSPENIGNLIRQGVADLIPNPAAMIAELIVAAILLVGGFLIWLHYRQKDPF